MCHFRHKQASSCPRGSVRLRGLVVTVSEARLFRMSPSGLSVALYGWGGLMPKLTLVVERTALKVYDIDHIEHPVIRVGREMGLEVVIDNVAVSRHQAEIRLQDALWFVRDLESGNGTFLNGRRLGGSAPLKRGDEISFGKFSLFFDHVPAEPAPPLYIPRTGHAEPGRTLVMRPEELAKIRASVVEKRRAHVRWQAGGDEGIFTLTDGETVIGRDDDCDLQVDCRGPNHH